MKWVTTRLFAIFTLAISICYGVMPTTAFAATNDEIAQTGCDTANIPYYTGTLASPIDTYDLYVKLGKPGQLASVSVSARPDDDSTHCQAIGATEASGNEWRKIGSYAVPNRAATFFQLSSPALADLPSANRPSLMLVSQTNPVCVPTTECFVTLAGQKASIRPAGTSPEDSALHIARVSPVNTSNITKVQYYADNELLYETKTLQDFKTEDIPYYANKLVRVASYPSGQMAVIETTAPKERTYDIGENLQPYVRKYSGIFVLVGALVGIVLLVRSIQIIRRYVRQRRRWKIDHGFLHEPAELAVTPEQIRRLKRLNMLRTTYTYTENIVGIVFIVVCSVFIANTFLFQIGTVSGSSMNSTLSDGQKIVINKIPTTFAGLNRTQYVPKRGEIVVAKPNFGTPDQSFVQDNTSLIVKRICGLPGERIVFDSGKYTVYNSEHPNGFDPITDAKWAANVQQDTTPAHIEVRLAENELFLCGDNQSVSIDSRYNGPISTSQVVGIVE